MTIKRYDAPKLRPWSDDAQGFCVVDSTDYDALLSLNAELLESLEKCVDLIQLFCPIEGHEVRRANDIIAKARGQS